MTKENENINLFVIEKEYKRLKKEQNYPECFSGNEIVPMLDKSQTQKLLAMHPTFEVTPEPNEQIVNPFVEGSPDASDGSPDTSDVLDVLSSFQEVSTKEQELLELKHRLLATQQDLHSKLVKEIDKKKKAVDNLISEIPNLQNACKQLSQVLEGL